MSSALCWTFGRGSSSSQSPLQCTCLLENISVKQAICNFSCKGLQNRWAPKTCLGRIFREVEGAWEPIHSCGFIHNDLNSNNVVSEQREGQPSPVIIDFGKSVLAEKAKSTNGESKTHQKPLFLHRSRTSKWHSKGFREQRYLFPDLFMIKSLYKILDFKLNGTAKNALKEFSDNRPSWLLKLKCFLVSCWPLIMWLAIVCDKEKTWGL